MTDTRAIEHIPMLYEDNEVLVIDKPAGLLVHSDEKSNETTLVDWILETHPEMKGVGESSHSIPRPGIVHRLDKETSGVLVLAKTQKAFEHLKKQFQERRVQKTYNAFVYGKVKEKTGVIDLPIGKDGNHIARWSAQKNARGTLREAVTQYTVLQHGEKHTYIQLHPKTGRTHQIRVHLKAINHSVVCDSLYASGQECSLGFTRLALHARRIIIELPGGTPLRVEAPPPEDFEKALSLF